MKFAFKNSVLKSEYEFNKKMAGMTNEQSSQIWKKSHTLNGAAVRLHLGIATAKRYHGDFIRAVAKNYGLMDD